MPRDYGYRGNKVGIVPDVYCNKVLIMLVQEVKDTLRFKFEVH